MKPSSAARTAVLAAATLLGGCTYAVSPVDASDPAIQARLEAALKADKELDLRYVTIDVHSRVLTISGLVSSHEEKVRISRIAHRVKGAQQVVVNLIVQE